MQVVANDITAKIETTYQRDELGEWVLKLETTNDYGYYRGQLYRINSETIDHCPSYCETCGEGCDPFTLSTRAEFNWYDIFGRRIAQNVCHEPDFTEEDNELFAWCKSDLVHFDYAGLSHQVVAERHDPYILEEDGPVRYLVGDRFVSTCLHGPMGLIARTAERSVPHPSPSTDLRDHSTFEAKGGGPTSRMAWSDETPLAPDAIMRAPMFVEPFQGSGDSVGPLPRVRCATLGYCLEPLRGARCGVRLLVRVRFVSTYLHGPMGRIALGGMGKRPVSVDDALPGSTPTTAN